MTLMAMKFNKTNNCYDFSLSDETATKMQERLRREDNLIHEVIIWLSTELFLL